MDSYVRYKKYVILIKKNKNNKIDVILKQY